MGLGVDALGARRPEAKRERAKREPDEDDRS